MSKTATIQVLQNMMAKLCSNVKLMETNKMTAEAIELPGQSLFASVKLSSNSTKTCGDIVSKFLYQFSFEKWRNVKIEDNVSHSNYKTTRSLKLEMLLIPRL